MEGFLTSVAFIRKVWFGNIELVGDRQKEYFSQLNLLYFLIESVWGEEYDAGLIFCLFDLSPLSLRSTRAQITLLKESQDKNTSELKKQVAVSDLYFYREKILSAYYLYFWRISYLKFLIISSWGRECRRNLEDIIFSFS